MSTFTATKNLHMRMALGLLVALVLLPMVMAAAPADKRGPRDHRSTFTAAPAEPRFAKGQHQRSAMSFKQRMQAA